MTRIKSDELCCMDIEWYGIDKNGKIAVFCSAGEANVPEFVCADKEKYEQLVDLFDRLTNTSDTMICFKPSKKNSKPVEVAEDFSGKGIYYFNSDDCSMSEKNIATLQRYYTITSKPVSPIKLINLPIEMQELLKENFLPIDDFDKMIIIDVEHAYR